MTKPALIILLIIIAAGGIFAFRKLSQMPGQTATSTPSGNGVSNCALNDCPFTLTEADNGKTFTYTVTSRFTVVLPSGRDATALKCAPEGVVGQVADMPPGGNSARFEAVREGSCKITSSDGNFSVEIVVAGESGSKGILPYNFGVRGNITVGPTCPVEKNPPEPQCADKPLSTLVAVFRKSDPVHAFAIGESDANGAFSFSLPPGEYVIGAGESNLPRCPQTPVTVGPQGYQSIAISCDSGIR